MANPLPPQPAGPIVVHPDPASPDDIRAAGWVVAVHNDYRLAGVPHTFWLFTRDDAPPRRFEGNGDGRYAKGEGPTDAEALNAVRWAVGLPLRPVLAGGSPVRTEPEWWAPAPASHC